MELPKGFRFQIKSENIKTLIQSRLNLRKVNEEFRQYDDLLKLFLDTHCQHHSRPEYFQQIENGNCSDEVDQYIFILKHLALN